VEVVGVETEHAIDVSPLREDARSVIDKRDVLVVVGGEPFRCGLEGGTIDRQNVEALRLADRS